MAMNGGADHGTDAASIKPVSSLRSHFEGLHLRKPSQDDSPQPINPPGKPDGSNRGSSPRASFDIPRAPSPWNGEYSTAKGVPTTPGQAGRRPESPTKSGQKRALSLLKHSSPRLTPAVTIDSPRSPPKGYFFDRSPSRSPERATDNTPFGKVRELISQHSSRSSSRPGTPQVEGGERGSINANMSHHDFAHAIATETAKTPTSTAPPINRAEKPKIPAKPSTFPSHDLSGLVSQPPTVSVDTRISPFNTPPSSDEDKAPERGTMPPPMKAKQIEPVPSRSTVRKVSVHHDQPVNSPELPKRIEDPRVMGFGRPPDQQERRDPRAMGFGSVAPRPPSRDASPLAPVRAHTISERPTPRDPRTVGLSSTVPTPRHVSENIRHLPKPTAFPLHTAAPRSAPVRDARLFGLSGSDATLQPDVGPNLPPRRTGTEPPLRTPEDTSRLPIRDLNHPSPAAAPDRSTKPPARVTAINAAANLPDSLSTTPLFPPPPKRNAVADLESPSLSSTRSPALPPVRSGTGDRSQLPSHARLVEDSDEAEDSMEEPTITRTEYPDMSQANRRPPFFKGGLQELQTKSDSRVFDVCGQYLCIAGYTTRVFDLSSGEQIMSLNHGETVKVLSVAFKPAADLDGEGAQLWIGNNIGELHEIDIATHSTLASSLAHNKREIVRILRCRKDLWTLDSAGKLLVWPAHESGMPSLKYSHLSHEVQKGHSFSLVIQDKLWLATGKELRIYRPGNEAAFVPLTKPLSQNGTGEITSGAYYARAGGRAYFGHADGKVTIYSTQDYSCLGNIKASDYKITGLTVVADCLWAAYKTGKIYVYDTSSTPWKVMKAWRAHDGPASGMMLDLSSVRTLAQLQVISVGQDNAVRLWDGMLEDDWLETAMTEHDVEYCTFREIRAAVTTWNVGASNPMNLQGDFVANAIHADDPPEILAFGFQEVVDLEDRAVTAKTILGFGKKKDTVKTEQHQSKVYREWRDYLSKVVNSHTDARYSYSELHTSSLIGLFQCIFIRQEERQNIHGTSATNVKCGMGGHYGNKGALITRFILDDSSLCFINCHLAAGQTHTSQRNNDVHTILESESLPIERNPDDRSYLFVGGGDGSQILDHEICILNGDLNYRIDAVPRDTVVNMVKRNELTKLLERDQLMVSRRRVSGFRLSPFMELPINFEPTYKYDVGTDNYDSSEKKRSPAWCDRILYRGPGRVKQLEYRRHEVKASDHRPVSGIFKIRVKTIDETKRQKVKEIYYQAFGEVKRKLAADASVEYLVNALGLPEREARRLIEGSK